MNPHSILIVFALERGQADGIAESLINRLSELPQLQVMARGTSFRYRGSDVDPRAAGRELGVRAVLRGVWCSVRIA